MNRSKIITHQGKEILYQDFSGLKTADEVNDVITKNRVYFHSRPLGTAMSLANIEGMHFNNQIKDLFMNFVKENKPYMKASAIIGVTGLKQVVFNGIMKITGRDVKSFNNEDQAKEWLVSQN